VPLHKGLTQAIESYRSGLTSLAKSLKGVLTETHKAALKSDTDGLVHSGVPSALARSLAELRFKSYGPDMVLIARAVNRPVQEIAGVHFRSGTFFRLGELQAMAQRLLVTDYFDRIAINSAIGAMSDAQRAIVLGVVRSGSGNKADFGRWHKANAAQADRTRRALDEILDGGDASLSRLMVAVSHLRGLSPA
jgi:glutamate dehydrogenase